MLGWKPAGSREAMVRDGIVAAVRHYVSEIAGPVERREPSDSPVAYLVNQYPKVSHSFIRREILALERQGVAVAALRACAAGTTTLADADDRGERERTRYLLQHGRRRLLGAAAVAIAFDARRSASPALRSGLRDVAPVEPRPCAITSPTWPRPAALVALAARRPGATHLHAHFGTNSAEVAMLARELGGPPYSFTVHGPEEFDSPERARPRREDARRRPSSSPISSFGRSQLLPLAADGRTGRRSRSCTAASTPAFLAARRPRPPAAPRLVCVGRLCEQKGQLLLVEAAQRVVARGRPLELVLAGDGEMRAELEALIDALGLRANVSASPAGSPASRVRERDPRGPRAGAAELRRGPAGRDHGGDGAAPAGDHAPTSPAFPSSCATARDGWLVPAGDVDALAQAIERLPRRRPPSARRAWARRRARACCARHDVDVEAAKLAALFARVRGARAPEAPMSEARCLARRPRRCAAPAPALCARAGAACC